jgi:hypothetical protein
MPEVVTWAAVAVAIGSVISILTFWTRYSDRITEAEAEAKAAEQAAHGASILAQGLQVKLEAFQKEFADYRESAAIKFVSDRDLIQAENRMAGLVENIQRDIRGVAERLDRVLISRNDSA